MNKPPHILLIDDDPDDKLLFHEALVSVQSQTCFNYFGNGRDAINWLSKTEELPDYIFLDLNMPRMNGKETLEEIKKNPRLKPLPVIVYSTSNNEIDKQECKRLGAALYITKPYRLADLKEVIVFAIKAVEPGYH